MSQQDIEMAIGLARQMYTDNDPAMRSGAEAQLVQNVSKNGDILLGMLKATDDPYALMYAGLSVVHWFKAHRDALINATVAAASSGINNPAASPPSMRSTVMGHGADLSQHRGVMSSVVETIHAAAIRLYTNPNSPRHILPSLLSSLSRVTKLTYERESTAVSYVVSYALEVLAAQKSPEEVHFALISLNSLVQEMSLFDSSKSNTFINFAAHRRCSNNFRDVSMLAIFVQAIEQLARVNGTQYPSISETIQLVRLSLTYDFMAIIVDETEEALSSQFPSSWKDVLLSERVQMTLWNAHSNLPMPYCGSLMTGIAAFCGTRRSFFDGEEERQRFLDTTLRAITNVGLATDGRLENSDYCTYLAEACLRFVSPYGYRDLSGIASFGDWLRFLERFSITVFSGPFGESASFNTTTTLLKFWTRIGNSKRLYVMDEDRVKDIELLAPNCALAFFKSRVLAAPMSSDIEDVAETMSAQSDLFHSLCAFETPLLMQELANYMSQAGPIITQNGYVCSLAWSLYLCGSVVKGCFNVVIEENVVPYSGFLAAAVSFADCARQVFQQQQNPAEAMALESALLFFLQALQSSFGSPRLNPNPTQVVANVFESKLKMFQFFLNSLGHNLMRSISQEYVCEEKVLIKGAIDLIWDVCRDMPTDVMSQLKLELPPIVDLPVSQYKDTFKLRTNLYTALWAVKHSSVATYTQQTLNEFLGQIDSLIYMTTSGQNTSPLFIAGWLRDLRGVSKATCLLQNVFSDFVEWILERATMFYQLSSAVNQPIVTISLLRFVCELVTPPSAYGRVNVSAATHSATGVLLFKFVAQMIQNVLTNAINDEMIAKVESGTCNVDVAYEFMLKPIFLCMQTLRRCINGDFVPFGAMTFYRDPVYDDTVVGMCRLLAVFPLYLFTYYPKVPAEAMDLLRSMTETQVFSPLACMGQSDLVTLIEFAIAIATNIDTKISPLLHALSFLGFVANLVKPTKELLEKRAMGTPQLGGISPAHGPMSAPTAGMNGNDGSSGSGASALVRSSRHIKERIAEKLVDIPELWGRLITTAMNIVVCQDRGLSACSQVVFPIFEADPMFWTTFAEEFVMSYREDKRPAVAEAITALGNASDTQDKFFSEIFTFRATIRKI